MGTCATVHETEQFYCECSRKAAVIGEHSALIGNLWLGSQPFDGCRREQAMRLRGQVLFSCSEISSMAAEHQLSTLQLSHVAPGFPMMCSWRINPFDTQTLAHHLLPMAEIQCPSGLLRSTIDKSCIGLRIKVRDAGPCPVAAMALDPGSCATIQAKRAGDLSRRRSFAEKFTGRGSWGVLVLLDFECG